MEKKGVVMKWNIRYIEYLIYGSPETKLIREEHVFEKHKCPPRKANSIDSYVKIFEKYIKFLRPQRLNHLYIPLKRQYREKKNHKP
jgi:hypothetical protein